MIGRVKISAASLAFVVLTVSMLTAGCNSKDTSGFKAEEQTSKEQINQRIAAVKGNPRIPSQIKDKAIRQLEQDLAKAK